MAEISECIIGVAWLFPRTKSVRNLNLIPRNGYFPCGEKLRIALLQEKGHRTYELLL